MQQRQEDMTYNDYSVAIICAIEFEMSAVRYILDEEHSRLPAQQGDSNDYILGQMCGHNVVLAWLPGNQGKSAAAIVGTDLDRTFPSIKWRILTGIGGGVPSKEHDIRLGDVVVSMPEGQHGGVVQYDLGKDTDDGFKLKGFLSAPPPRLRAAAGKMRSDHRFKDNRIDEFVGALLNKGRRLKAYARPAAETDVLTDADPPRLPREFVGPEIHYGLIASGDGVMRSISQRSLQLQVLGDVLCFEMEAAGLMTDRSYIVIRGISDYADSFKNDKWQFYAAAAAAACTKELLTYLDVEVLEGSAHADISSRNASQIHSSFTGRGVQHVGNGNFSVGRDLHMS